MSPPPDTSRFNDLLLKVGRLNYAWTNTESLLIHFIAGLSGTDKDTAVIIFLTLNTTRARVDLVERLAKLPRTPKDAREQIIAATREMMGLSALRNRYNHCIYAFDPDGGNPRTILMRIADRKRDIRVGQVNEIDAAAISDIEASIAALTALNEKFWSIIRTFSYPV